MRIKNYFHNNGFALSLALKLRLEATRKWPILFSLEIKINEYIVFLFFHFDQQNESHHDSDLSMRSKRFRLVSEQRKTSFGCARNETRAKK